MSSWTQVTDAPDFHVGETTIRHGDHWYTRVGETVYRAPVTPEEPSRLGLPLVDPGKDLAMKLSAINAQVKSTAANVNATMTALAGGQGSVGSAKTSIAGELATMAAHVQSATADVAIDAAALAKPALVTVPPQGDDPVQDIIQSWQTIAALSKKAQGPGGNGCLTSADWAVLDQNLRNIASDTADIIKKPGGAAAPATGMTPTQAGLLGGGLGTALGLGAGFAIGRATAGAKKAARDGGSARSSAGRSHGKAAR